MTGRVTLTRIYDDLPIPVRSAALMSLSVLAVLYTAYFTAPLSIPITTAFLLHFLLSPVVNRLVRWRMPRTVSALLVILALVAATAGGLYRLAEPAAGWLREAPTNVDQLRSKFRHSPNPLADVRQASEAVEQAVDDITNGGERAQTAQAVQISEPGLLDTVLNRVPIAVGAYFVTLIVALFLLISGDSLLRKLTSMGRTFAARRRTVLIVRQIERDIARYLGTVALVNLCLGAVVALAMYLVGLPNPLLWGTVAGVLNFAPYLGAAVSACVIFMAGVNAFATIPDMVMPALLFVLITALEGQFVTPLLLGQRLELSPVVVLLSVLVLGWLWGLVGALIAVPVIASLRIVLVRVPNLRPVGTLLAR